MGPTSCGASIRGEAPEEYTEADGWRRLQIWGMGIASADITGDGYPEVYLTSQGDNKLQTLADGPAQPTYEDIALERGATAHRPFTGGDVLPSTAWHAEFGDVNDDGFLDLFVVKGNVEAQEDYAMRDPNNLLLGQADGTFVEGAEEAGIVSFQRGRGGAVVDLNLDGLLDLVVVNRVEPVSLWRNVGAGSADEAEPMGNGSPFVSASRRRTSTPSGRGWRCAWGTARSSTRSRSAAGTPAGSSAGCISVSETPPKARFAFSGPMARSARGWRWTPTVSRSSSAVRRRRRRGTRRRSDDTRDETSRARRRRAAGLRDAGDRAAASRRASMPSGWNACATRMEQRRYDHLVVWADREHSANLAYLTGFDPRFEEAVLVVSPGGDPALLVGNENLATAEAAPLPLRCVRFQDLSLPGQPRDGSLPLPEILAAEGIGVWEQRGCRRLEDVRRPGHDGSAIVPRRRAAPDDGPDGCRRERH